MKLIKVDDNIIKKQTKVQMRVMNHEWESRRFIPDQMRAKILYALLAL